MSVLERCGLRPLAVDDLATILAWRNDPSVRLRMLTQHEIGMEEHRSWFDRASQDSSRVLLLAEDQAQPVGFVHFSDVAREGVASWGFYAAPEAPRGSGSKLCASALDFAFNHLELHKVCGQVLDSNEPSVRLHERLGFHREGVLRQQHRLGAAWHDLLCFGLLRREWQ